MNYYKRHIGDYAKKTGHFSTWEHGAYNLILDRYYDREVAPTTVEAMRWAMARNPDETSMVTEILYECFNFVNERWVQQRVEDELGAAKAKAEHNRKVGKLGGRPPRARKTIRVPSGLTLGTQTEPKHNPNPLIQDLEQELPLDKSNGHEVDPDKFFWDAGVSLLGAGKRGLLGKLVKQHGRDHVLRAIGETVSARCPDPASYLVAVLDQSRKPGRKDANGKVRVVL